MNCKEGVDYNEKDKIAFTGVYTCRGSSAVKLLGDNRNRRVQFGVADIAGRNKFGW